MLDGDVEFVRGEKGLDGVGGGIHERAGFGKRAVVGGICGFDGGGEFGIVEQGMLSKNAGRREFSSTWKMTET